MMMALHFHIRWSGGRLDWESFDSRTDAEASAIQLVRQQETYTIETFDEACPVCANLLKRTPPAEPQKIAYPYPWQQLIADAFNSPAAELPGKVNAAERAISARLLDPTISALDERIALKSALRALRNLLPDERRPSQFEEKKETA